MYHNKYKKYVEKIVQMGGKKECETAKDCGQSKKKFYFIHNPMGYSNMTEILKSGEMKLGSEVSKRRRKMSCKGFENIFTMIYFPDLKNIKHWPGLVFSQDLFYDYDLHVDAGWGNVPIVDIKKEDTKREKNKALKKIRAYVEKRELYLSEKLAKMLPDFMSNQVLFNKRIPLDKYLVAICGYCNFENDKDSEKIKKLLEKKGLFHVKCIRSLEDLEK
jgi:hypothetical protein